MRSQTLGWSEPYYESGNWIGDQDYLTYWVLAQALVVEISGAPILLARYLINPFVVTMSVASMYVFARNLGHGRNLSLCVVILGMVALSLIAEKGKLPGNQFFVHAHLDKVLAAFALAPVAISSAWLYARSGSHFALWGFALSFLSCAFVHSVIGGFALCVIGVWCLLRFFTMSSERKRIYAIGLLALTLFVPSILLRLTTLQPTITPFGSGDLYYTIEPHKAGLPTYLLIVLTAITAAARRDPRSTLLLSFVLVIGIGLLPFTSWIYNFLLPEFQVVRVVWLMPYGYMIAFVFGTGRRMELSYNPLQRLSLDQLRIPLLFFAFLITAYFLQFHSRADFSRDIGNVTEEVIEMLEIAEYINLNHADRVWVAASPEPEYRNRAISMNWKVISLSRYSAERMAYYSNLPIEQASMQRNDNFRLYRADVPVEEKLAIIDRYGIDYLLFPKGYAWMIDALYQRDKQRFELVYSGATLRLVRVHEKSP